MAEKKATKKLKGPEIVPQRPATAMSVEKSNRKFLPET